jgi:hypothetical protein
MWLTRVFTTAPPTVTGVLPTLTVPEPVPVTGTTMPSLAR